MAPIALSLDNGQHVVYRVSKAPSVLEHRKQKISREKRDAVIIM
jgi:hypothetical protein